MSVIWHDFNDKNFDICGVNNNFYRLPEELAKSISEGVAANARCPAGAEYALLLISQKYNLNYLNFGFAGSARGETPLIEYIAKLDISAFVSDYDHNAYDIELLKATHLNMYKTGRKYKPDIPYFIITRPKLDIG